MKSGLELSYILAGFALAVLLAGCPKKQEIALTLKPSSDDSVQVMTFNIRYGTAKDGANSWRYRKEACFKQIAETSADVVSLQEA